MVNSKFNSPTEATARETGNSRDNTLLQSISTASEAVQRPHPEVHRQLADWLDHSDESVAHLAVVALGRLGGVAELDLVRGLDSERPPSVRQAAASGLASQGVESETALATLCIGLGDEDEIVRQLSAVALGRSGEAAVKPLLKTLESGTLVARQESIQAFGWLGASAGDAPPHLEPLLDEPDPILRLRAARALVLIPPRNDKALELLLQAAEDSENDIRALAAENLGQLGCDSDGLMQSQEFADRVVACLVGLGQDSDSKVASAALLALGRLRTREPSVLQVLDDNLGHQDAEVRRHALLTLASWGPDAEKTAKHVESLQSDTEIEIATLATATLEKIQKVENL
jgi:HEAT repeat protein